MRMTAVVACFDHGPFGPAAGPRRLAPGASRPGGLSGWAVVHHAGGRYCGCLHAHARKRSGQVAHSCIIGCWTDSRRSGTSSCHIGAALPGGVLPTRRRVQRSFPERRARDVGCAAGPSVRRHALARPRLAGSLGGRWGGPVEGLPLEGSSRRPFRRLGPGDAPFTPELPRADLPRDAHLGAARGAHEPDAGTRVLARGRRAIGAGISDRRPGGAGPASARHAGRSPRRQPGTRALARRGG